jgi:hypothetical protein
MLCLLVAGISAELPRSRARADWTYPSCAAWEAWDVWGNQEQIYLCLARNGDLWRGAAVHRSGANSYGAVSVWYSATACNNMPEATLVAYSNTEPLYTKTVTNDGYHAGAGKYCVIYRHQDPIDTWYNEVAVFNDQLQLLDVFGDPSRD